jgi:hypothetical protein
MGAAQPMVVTGARETIHQPNCKTNPISEFEFRFIGLPEIREKSELLLYPAAIFDGCLVVIGVLLVATR